MSGLCKWYGTQQNGRDKIDRRRTLQDNGIPCHGYALVPHVKCHAMFLTLFR